MHFCNELFDFCVKRLLRLWMIYHPYCLRVRAPSRYVDKGFPADDFVRGHSWYGHQLLLFSVTSLTDLFLDCFLLAPVFFQHFSEPNWFDRTHQTQVEDTVDFLLEASDRHNAVQLKAVCMHFIRNDRELHN